MATFVLSFICTFIGVFVGCCLCCLYNHIIWIAYLIRDLIRDYILYPIMNPKSIIWSIKHHINYFHMSKKDLYELDNDAWNEFLMLFVEPDKRRQADYDRNLHLAIKAGLNKEEAFYKCEVIQPIRDLLIKGDKKDEN